LHYGQAYREYRIIKKFQSAVESDEIWVLIDAPEGCAEEIEAPGKQYQPDTATMMLN
jgi:hypothetical protein